MNPVLTSEMLHKSTQRGWLWNGVEQFATRGLSMLVSLVLARLLAPESFGLIAAVSIFLATAQQLIDGGIGVRIVQKKMILEEDYIAFFWCNAAVSLLTCGSLVIFAGAIARFYGHPQLRSVVMVLAVVVFMMNVGRVQQTMLIREFRFKTISLVSIASVVAGSITGLILAFAGCGIWAILGQQLVISAVQAAVFWVMVPWRPAGLPTWPAVKELYAFGMPLLISQTIRGFSEQLINVLAARYFGMAPLGYYDRGRFIPGNVASFFQSVFFRTNLAVLSKLQHDEEAFRKVYLKLVGIMALICMLLMTGLSVCAPEIIEIVLGSKWLPSVWILRAGCVMSLLYFLFLINLDALKAKGNVSSVFFQNLIYASLQIVGVGSGFCWGFRGMVTGSIVAGFFSCIMLIRAVDQVSQIKTRDQFAVFIRPVLWSLLTGSVLWWLKQIGLALWPQFLLCGAAGSCLALIAWRLSTHKGQHE